MENEIECLVVRWGDGGHFAEKFVNKFKEILLRNLFQNYHKGCHGNHGALKFTSGIFPHCSSIKSSKSFKEHVGSFKALTQKLWYKIVF